MDVPTTPSPSPVPRLALAAASIAAAFVIAALQRHPLGDQPFALLGVVALLAAIGGAMRIARPRAVGFAASVGFPVQALVDLAANGGHTLLPFEFAIYVLYALAAAGVAYAAGALAQRRAAH